MPEGVAVASVACGDSHSAAVTSDGKLYTWGWGGSLWSGSGLLGHGDGTSHTTPKLVESLLEEEGLEVKTAVLGELHTAILTTDGEVFSCGIGEYGRLGNGSSSDTAVMEPLDYINDQEVTQLSSGHAFTLALTAEGKVLCWGRNDQGQLGQGATMSLDVYSMEMDPRLIDELEHEEIVHISAGHSHAAAVTKEGELYMWGMKNHLAPKKFMVAKDPSDNEEPVPLKVAKVACGMNFTMAVTTDGELFSFGRYKALGHEPTPQPKFVRCLNGSQVHDLFTGGYHVGAFISTSPEYGAPESWELDVLTKPL